MEDLFVIAKPVFACNRSESCNMRISIFGHSQFRFLFFPLIDSIAYRWDSETCCDCKHHCQACIFYLQNTLIAAFQSNWPMSFPLAVRHWFFPTLSTDWNQPWNSFCSRQQKHLVYNGIRISNSIKQCLKLSECTTLFQF